MVTLVEAVRRVDDRRSANKSEMPIEQTRGTASVPLAPGFCNNTALQALLFAHKFATICNDRYRLDRRASRREPLDWRAELHLLIPWHSPAEEEPSARTTPCKRPYGCIGHGLELKGLHSANQSRAVRSSGERRYPTCSRDPTSQSILTIADLPTFRARSFHLISLTNSSLSTTTLNCTSYDL